MSLFVRYQPIALGGGGGGGGNQIALYPTFSAFPLTATNGAFALALDTDVLYVYNTTSNSWVAIAGPGAIVPVMEEITLTPTDISNGYVTLTHTPNDSSDVLVNPNIGPAQVYLVDYAISTNLLLFAGYGLSGIVSSGDILIVNYFYFDPTATRSLGGPGGGGGGSNPYYVNAFTLSPTDITNKYVTLTVSPDSPSLTALTVIGGPMQEYGIDFTVSGTQLSWSGLFLDGVLNSGDVLVVQYN